MLIKKHADDDAVKNANRWHDLYSLHIVSVGFQDCIVEVMK